MNKIEMLESVKHYLSNFGKVDRKILKAMENIDRKEFVSIKLKKHAYLDQALPTKENQTISQPSTVARILSLLKLKKSDTILEIGTGSGWNASLLAYLTKNVLSLEIVPELVSHAKKVIKKLNIKNIQIQNKDFRKLKQKFDKIIFTAGITFSQEKEIENYTKDHLKENGILICPFQSGPLILIKKQDNKIKKNYTQDKYRFVKLN